MIRAAMRVVVIMVAAEIGYTISEVFGVPGLPYMVLVAPDR
jgi:hypothetical protein